VLIGAAEAGSPEEWGEALDSRGGRLASARGDIDMKMYHIEAIAVHE